MKRIFTWGGFIVVIGLIVWGMVAASNKAERESAGVAAVDQVTDTDWVKGAATSSLVTIIEYSDFQCPACAAYFPVMEKLVAENPFVRFVYRHFPLPQHGNAIPASEAAEAAGNQGKFWEMYGMIFETQTEWESVTDIKPVFSGYAKKLGLDMAKYAEDVDSKEVSDAIDADIKSGLKAGINSTPTFYVNGKKISNPQGYEEFKKIIDDAAAAATNS
ncbi:MAG: thioredoxin domain-containing protein [Patescibacteria group bacterium]